MRLEGYTVNVINIVIGVAARALGDLHQLPRLGLGPGLGREEGARLVRPGPTQAPTDGCQRQHQRKVSTMKFQNGDWPPWPRWRWSPAWA